MKQLRRGLVRRTMREIEDGHMPRVLIVEDQKRLLGSLQRGLKEEGFEISAAPTGEEGFYLATTQEPDVIVLDLMLPRRHGFQVLTDLRARLQQADPDPDVARHR